MVGLAKDLEDQLLPLVVSYCQRVSKEGALGNLTKEKWKKEMKNVLVMNRTRFPKAPVQYAPYHLIFSQAKPAA